mgnify:CR=1 FL=1
MTPVLVAGGGDHRLLEAAKARGVKVVTDERVLGWALVEYGGLPVLLLELEGTVLAGREAERRLLDGSEAG